jgi:HSP90 family molecular chaperone
MKNEDVVMKLFSLSLEENAKTWYSGFPDNSITSWDAFHDAFIKRWAVRKDARLMLTQLHEMKKKDSETIKDFDERFDKLLKDFPPNLKPNDDTILLHYTNAFEGKFGFLLRDKSPTTLERLRNMQPTLKKIYYPKKSNLSILLELPLLRVSQRRK